jgi:nucleoside-diphosphate-sugar epimerase
MAAGTDQAIKTTRVLLTGAGSQIGVFIIPRLVQAGCHVFAVSRKGKPDGFPSLDRVEWLDSDAAYQLCKSCQYLVSAGPMQLVQAFLKAGGHYQGVVVFSSSSVESKQNSNDAGERNQAEDLLAHELELRETAAAMALKLVIFRPTLVYGCGMDSNVSRLANWINRFGFIPVNGRASGLRQPVHADDLASVAVAAMFCKETLPGVMFLSGGEVLSYSDMVTRIFTALKKPVRLLRIPAWLFVLLVRFARIFRIAGGVNAEMVRRQQLDLVFDDRQARELLGYKPRPFAPGVEDFSLPDFRKLPEKKE